jgi:hypothetical protein
MEDDRQPAAVDLLGALAVIGNKKGSARDPFFHFSFSILNCL